MDNGDYFRLSLGLKSFSCIKRLTYLAVSILNVRVMIVVGRPFLGDLLVRFFPSEVRYALLRIAVLDAPAQILDVANFGSTYLGSILGLELLFNRPAE